MKINNHGKRQFPIERESPNKENDQLIRWRYEVERKRKKKKKKKKKKRKKKRWNTCEPSTTNPDSPKSQMLRLTVRFPPPSSLVFFLYVSACMERTTPPSPDKKARHKPQQESLFYTHTSRAIYYV